MARHGPGLLPDAHRAAHQSSGFGTGVSRYFSSSSAFLFIKYCGEGRGRGWSAAGAGSQLLTEPRPRWSLPALLGTGRPRAAHLPVRDDGALPAGDGPDLAALGAGVEVLLRLLL